MNGTLVNGIAIIIGGTIGLFLKKSLFNKISDKIMMALGLSIIVIAIQGVINYKDSLIMIISIALGAYIGELIDIDGRLTNMIRGIENKFSKKSEGTFTAGFVSASLLFVVGAMAIVGSLESGLNHNESILYTKSLLDFVSSIIFASTFGIGVLFSAFPVMLYQGFITILSQFIQPYLSEMLIADFTAVGSVCILAIGLNMTKATQFKIANLLPAIFVPFILRFILSFV